MRVSNTAPIYEMDFQYSPHRQGGGGLHLASPTHHVHNNGFPSIDRIRRSLSRSPSRTSRFSLHTNSPESPRSPISPLATSRAFTPKPSNEALRSFTPPTPLAQQPQVPPSSAKVGVPRFPIRRTPQLFRSSNRTRTGTSPRRTSPRRSSPRRALGESLNQGNSTLPLRTMPATEPAGKRFSMNLEKFETEPQLHGAMRSALNDEPIKFPFSRPRSENMLSKSDVGPPAKSSPLKRSDGIMNLDQASLGSPVAKRRSLHGASAFGTDFNIFDHGPDAEEKTCNDKSQDSNYMFSSPRKSPPPVHRKSSLRKSTFQQRFNQTSSKSPRLGELEFAVPGPAASKQKSRSSLDSSSNFVTSSSPNPFRRSTQSDGQQATMSPQSFLARSTSLRNQPHPLSNSLTPSSSSSSMLDESPTHAPAPALNHIQNYSHQPYRAPNAEPRLNTNFAKSLPIGAIRPNAEEDRSSEFSTPATFKMTKPLPAAFMSTGLISKRNRPLEDFNESYVMPDTPSKRASFPPVTATPFRRSGLKDSRGPDFGSPGSPFSVKRTPQIFGRGANIFGTTFDPNSRRRASFHSIDGDDYPPSPSRQGGDSQSSADELPPTPTRNTSLRSSLFGRRVSLGPDTFSPPDDEKPTSPRNVKTVTPVPGSDSERLSPHTPQESFMPPDPSSLSISNHAPRRGSHKPGNSTSNITAFPPATPTAPRESYFFGKSQGPVHQVIANEVDTTLTSRFGLVSQLGKGEFSSVFRVERPLDNMFGASTPAAKVHKVWAVKKSKTAFLGVKDRQDKYREVEILKRIRGHEHMVEYVDHWEARGHLYIQTDFCENGNLDMFLTVSGHKARMDDFRIWKILLELSAGVEFIHSLGLAHLDIKPANVLIDFSGVLKIADFGLAAAVTVDSEIHKGGEGEGDVYYMAPEQLKGRHDKPADVFALGLIVLEMAGNVFLPKDGKSWQSLRNGDFSDVPSLTWSTSNDLNRDESGEPIHTSDPDLVDLFNSMADAGSFEVKIPKSIRPHERTTPPAFMVSDEDPDSLKSVLPWMLNPDPDQRANIQQIRALRGIDWVGCRRRFGATVFEGIWGPADDVLNYNHGTAETVIDFGNDVDMIDA